MVNITNLEASFTNARILFRIGLGNEFKAPKIKVGGTDKSGISVEIEKTSLIGGIMAKGNLNGKQTDIDFNSVSGLTPFKMTSVSTQDKVTMFAD
ncbi:UNVERIFIED_CONTAM: hypothetical protein RF648_20515 [Kocuria sp. CPCC 205274]|uniref:Uncharacterized protein n=1 Tax=Herbiconiux daphne TaxID=2970914 RepID=A0ABT2H912_9MICO|nr:hypothetical protein [Herbiconiux daphne]MCS5736430.1 hypothetical protein [Herbiconiux daphne]